MVEPREDSVIRLNTDPELNLREVTMEELTLQETIKTLFEGGTILLTSYDNDKGKDTLVRFQEKNGDIITQVSKPTTTAGGFVGSSRYWTIFDVTFNTLSLYPTYLYDSTRYMLGNKFETNCTVSYKSIHGDIDIAMVKGVFSDDDGNYYYTLSGESSSKYFKEEDLQEV